MYIHIDCPNCEKKHRFLVWNNNSSTQTSRTISRFENQENKYVVVHWPEFSFVAFRSPFPKRNQRESPKEQFRHIKMH